MKFSIKYFINLLIKKARFRKAGKIIDFQLLHFNSVLTNVNLDKGVMVTKNASLSCCSIGRYSSIGRNTKIVHANIGAFCAISWDCTINAISHPIENLTISAFAYVPHVGNFVSERRQNFQQVVIGNDVWIGAQVIIMPGISIGDGAIIGAGSVVTKDVGAYQIVAGNPAKFFRCRFELDIINKLLENPWWELSDEVIKKNIYLFQQRVDLDLLKELRELDAD